MRNDGDVDGALKGADKVIVGEYYLPHLAHVSMEPPVATADVKNGKAEIWAPVQSPGGTREDVAKTLDIPVENVTVHVTLLGGGFGRKSKCDYALEAALLSQKLGAPVRVQWTREDDVRHDFFHTVSAERIEAGLDKSGKVVAWRHRSAAPSIGSTFEANTDSRSCRSNSAWVSWTCRSRSPTSAARTRQVAAHTRIGWFRSVSNIPHAFAIQSMVAEIAHATGRDPKDMLLELIGPARMVELGERQGFWNYGEPMGSYPIDAGRLRRVVEMVADKGEWGRKLPPGHGLGIAAHRSFVSYIATIVEVAVNDKGEHDHPARGHRRSIAAPIVNPERIRSQMEGAVIMGISLAKYGEITFKDGRVEQGNFDDYPVARIDEAPLVTNVHIMPPGAETPPSGVGRARRAARRARVGQRDLRRDRPALAGDADRSAARDGRLHAEQPGAPRSEPASQVSTAPSGAAPARTETTGSAPLSPKVQQMNNEAADKVNKEGK